VNLAFAKELAEAAGAERVLAAVDARGGKIAVRGWSEATRISPLDAIRELEPYCAGFLYTHIDAEGLMRGIPREIVTALRAATSRELIVAGGIRSHEEVAALDALGVHAVVGMAIYSGAMQA
jgi:phosphoribosylformimino-5-aminoimidazole carboxamide ribotide isomerase